MHSAGLGQKLHVVLLSKMLNQLPQSVVFRRWLVKRCAWYSWFNGRLRTCKAHICSAIDPYQSSNSEGSRTSAQQSPTFGEYANRRQIISFDREVHEAQSNSKLSSNLRIVSDRFRNELLPPQIPVRHLFIIRITG